MSHTPPRAFSCAILCIIHLTTLPVLAQRSSAKLAVGDREVALEYGAVPCGKHSLAELPIGAKWPAGDEVSLLVEKGLLRTGFGPAWRFGMNEASVFRTQVPLLASDGTVVAPGAYRVALHRKSEKEMLLVLAGAGLALGSETDFGIPGEVRETKTNAEKLALEWSPATQKNRKDTKLATELVARFGKHEVRFAFEAIAARSAKLPGFQVDVFAFDAAWLTERFEKKLATPWLALRPSAAKKERETFTLVVQGEKCSLREWMAAPEESFGFGDVHGPRAVSEGAVRTEKASAAKAVLEADKCERSAKGEFTLRFGFGDFLATAAVADATAKATRK